MKNHSRILVSTLKVALLSASLLTLSASNGLAQPKPKKASGLGIPAINSTERALGKKLTAGQKTQIINAAKAREKANGAAQKKNMAAFRVQLAKIAGVSLKQLEAKEKAAKR